jgi:cytidylate kinase
VAAALAVVAIDGPSGSGKSTVARRVAQRLGFRYLDTGAMYRALAWQALEHRVDLEDAAALAELAERARIEPGTNPRRPTIAIDGTDVSRPIRSRAVTNAVSAVSAVPGVRAVLVARQRELMAGGGIVVEGRDIGTTVAPEAPAKVFLTASSDARAARRHRQLASVGDAAAVHDTRAEIERRDAHDSSRAASPLAQAPDAVVIDSTTRSVDEVVGEVLALAARRGLAAPNRRGRNGASAGSAGSAGSPAATPGGSGTAPAAAPAPAAEPGVRPRVTPESGVRRPRRRVRSGS